MKPTVFLSYSSKDHFFAEVAGIKLAEAGIDLWRDKGQLRAGDNWQSGIEQGIANSIAILVALSQSSTQSPYVTFEWAYGLGKGKTVIPAKLEACTAHPRLETIQYLDFSVAGALPWNLLIERIREIEADATPEEDLTAPKTWPETSGEDPIVKAILAYLNQRGFQMVSYNRLRKRIDPDLSDERLDELIAKYPTVFRHVVLQEGKRGLAKLVP
jgi:hypothetical protein